MRILLTLGKQKGKRSRQTRNQQVPEPGPTKKNIARVKKGGMWKKKILKIPHNGK